MKLLQLFVPICLMPSFTNQIDNLLYEGPTLTVGVTIPDALREHLQKNKNTIPPPLHIHGLIDTGATLTVINTTVVKKLRLKPISVMPVHTPSSNNIQCYTYQVKIILPKHITAETKVIAAPLKDQHIQCLLGRDILKHGVFVYIGYTNQFTLSF